MDDPILFFFYLTDLRVDSSVLLDVVKGVFHEAAHAAVGGRVAVNDVLKRFQKKM